MRVCMHHYAYDTPYYDYSSGAPTIIGEGGNFGPTIRSFSPVHPVAYYL